MSSNLLASILFTPQLVTLAVLVLGMLTITVLRPHTEERIPARPGQRIATVPVHIQHVALLTSALAAWVGLTTLATFDKTIAGFQYGATFEIFPAYNIALSFGLDGISVVLFVLTLVTFPICILAGWNVANKKQFFLFLLSMEFFLLLTFSTSNLLVFYVSFEALLIPMYLLIGGWGARERKIKAGYYFFLYTLAGSLLLLVGLLLTASYAGSYEYATVLNTSLSPDQQKTLWVLYFIAFAVKMPLYPLHIWLPEAHVEAPTVGSMLLAALLLKLGGYGILRFLIGPFVVGTVQYGSAADTLALLGVLFGSLATLRQIDLKRIIAYSSVAHMNLVVLGLLSGSVLGIEGAIFLMVGHAVVSAALFFGVGAIYDRHHSRLVRYYGGLVVVMPLLATFFFLFTLANMSFPGTSNFLGELLVLAGLYSKNTFTLLFATPGIVLSAVYAIWLFNRAFFGTLKTAYIGRFTDLNLREVAVFCSLLLPMVALGVSSDLVLEYVHLNVPQLLTSTGQ